MGTTLWVTGERKPTEEYMKMKAAREACLAAKVAIPWEVTRFFEGMMPAAEGRPEKLDLEAYAGCTERLEDAYGVRVDLSMLPDGVTHIVFKVGL